MTTIQLRRGSAASWTSANPTLAAGELGIETDTAKMKIGDGTTAWASLAYFSGSGASIAIDDLTDVAITSAASGDILRHNGTAWVDVAGSTYFETAGAVATHAALPNAHAPAPTRTALGTSYTPSQLTMRVVHTERSRDVLPQDGPHTPLVDEFQTSSLLSSRYTVYNESGTANTETVDQGKLTVGSTAGCDRVYRAMTKLQVATGVFTAIRVEPGWSGTGYACCGFYSATSGSDFVHAQWELSTGALAISSKGSGANIILSTATGTADTIAGPTTSTGPLWLGLILAWPAAILVTSTDGRNWYPQTIRELTRTTDLVNATAWDTFRPGFRLVPGSSSSIKISRFAAGYAGSHGFRDQKPVTYADGTPFKKNGKYYLTGTVAHGSTSFRSNHMAVYSFDPWTYQTDLVCHLFYDLTGTGVGAGYGGQAVYDETTGQWHIVANSWGFDTVSTGVDLIYATTYRDITEPGAVVLQAQRLTGLSSFSLYDSSVRKSGSTWYVAAIETDVRTGWSGGNHASLFSGSALTSLSRIATDATTGVDGTCWTKIGGNWYITAADPSTFIAWDANLANKTTLTTWSSAAPAGLLSFSTFPPHCGCLAVDDGHQTRYIVVTYDSSLALTANASRGGLVVMQADEKPTGQEHTPKIVPRYYGT